VTLVMIHDQRVTVASGSGFIFFKNPFLGKRNLNGQATPMKVTPVPVDGPLLLLAIGG